MGFNKVYRSLLNLFPQIDARVLRAVAIEHSKDVDAAAEAVLMEIIPFLAEISSPTTPLARSICEGQSSQGSSDVENGHNVNSGTTLGAGSCHEVDKGHSGSLTDTYSWYHGGESSNVGLVLSRENLGNSRDEDVESVDKDENIIVDKNMNLTQSKVDCAHVETTLEAANYRLSDHGKCSADGSNTDRPSSSSVHDLTTGTIENTVQLAAIEGVQGSHLEESENSLSDNTSLGIEVLSNIVDIEDESKLKSFMSHSSQIHIMGVVKEIIASAESNKEALFSGMQSVISLMREVELKERAAEQAKMEAARGRADLLGKLEDLKKTVQLTKESNSMHAGEVFGEKAILATELRELQSRVLSLSSERDKSLTVLHEMRQGLEVRLAAAENEIKSAEQEKIEKEEAAMHAIAEQELHMERMAQESKILKLQAEENAKLQEFLMDRGLVVDMLQGELAVICHDVNLLKESFDENVGFSNSSISSTHTSSVLSSSKNANLDESAPDGAGTLLARDAVSCSPDDLSKGELKSRDDPKALVDDGWELFEGVFA